MRRAFLAGVLAGLVWLASAVFGVGVASAGPVCGLGMHAGIRDGRWACLDNVHQADSKAEFYSGYYDRWER